MSDPIAVKPRDAARMLSISLRTLQRWVNQGLLKPVKIGGVVLYRVEDLRKVVQR